MDHWYVWVILIVLLAITAGFGMHFVRPALRLRQEFHEITRKLRALKAGASVQGDLREHLATSVLASSTAVARVWGEYEQTLHAQQAQQVQEVNGASPIRWRATALAETFFTDQSLVDTPLKTDYYKHLPGILTGLGIIGTFTGLIIGLSNFSVSVDPVQAQAQLRQLINAVGQAFVVSAVAITLAMLFTWIEKSLVTACYRLVEEIRQLIDGLFDVGVDVEYLERLVRAAETSVGEVAEIRRSLADSIGQVFIDQTRRQIDASEKNSARIAQDLAQLLGSSLTQPITHIATAVETIGARQDETVTRMINEVLTGFSRSMEDMFAERMRDLHAVLAGTNTSMGTLADQFALMAGRMDNSGKESVQKMGDLVATAQTESTAKLEALLARMSQTTTEATGGVTAQVERLVANSILTQQRLQETVAALTRMTASAAQGMNEGAARIETAAASFVQVGERVAQTTEASAQAAGEMREAAASLNDTASSARGMLADYRESHDAFAQMTVDLRDTIDRARRESGLTAELTDKLEQAASRLGHMEAQAESYLVQVSSVLEHAHMGFRDSVERTLREANRQFQAELSQAVGLLSGAIADLGHTVDTLAEQGTPR